MWYLSCLSTTCVWKWASGYALNKTTDVTSTKRLKCDRCSEPRSLHFFVGFEEASTGNQGSACVSFWREEGVCALELSVQNHTHTHLPPAVHHKPPASHLLRTSWCGAQTHDNLCINLTSLSSYFLLASGGNPLFTWQEHQACMQRFPAVALPLRTCFSAFIQLTLFFFRFLKIVHMYPPDLSAL